MKLNIFNKEKKYNSYEDYLNEHHKELFETFIYDELLNITGVTTEELFKGKAKVKNNLTYEEALYCYDLVTIQNDTTVDFATEFRNRGKALTTSMADKNNVLEKNCTENYIFNHSIYQIPELKKMFIDIKESKKILNGSSEETKAKFNDLNDLNNIIDEINKLLSDVPKNFNFTISCINMLALMDVNFNKANLCLNRIKKNK